MLLDYRDIFSKNEFDIGLAPKVKYEIRLTNDTLIKQRHRRIPPAMYEEVRQHLQHLEQCGIIQRSCSLWAAPVVLARENYECVLTIGN